MADFNRVRDNIESIIQTARDTKPLVGSITNFVTVDFVANTQLAAGGSAAMVYLPDEAQGLIQLADAFYINVGTLLPSHEETICTAAATLCETNTPWVLDPVGIGLGDERTRILTHLREHTPSIIRCNASEAIALAKLWKLDAKTDTSGVKGVDSTDSVLSAQSSAIALAKHINGAVAVSGQTDLITDGHQIAYLKGGSLFMEKVTGFGCSLGGVCAVYAACGTSFAAALAASAAFNVAGLLANSTSDGPASFKAAFIDALYNVDACKLAGCTITLKEAS